MIDNILQYTDNAWSYSKSYIIINLGDGIVGRYSGIALSYFLQSVL
jgi:hypothetical protein